MKSRKEKSTSTHPAWCICWWTIHSNVCHMLYICWEPNFYLIFLLIRYITQNSIFFLYLIVETKLSTWNMLINKHMVTTVFNIVGLTKYLWYLKSKSSEYAFLLGRHYYYLRHKSSSYLKLKDVARGFLNTVSTGKTKIEITMPEAKR